MGGFFNEQEDIEELWAVRPEHRKGVPERENHESGKYKALDTRSS